MSTAELPAGVESVAFDFATLRDLYDRGLFLQAYTRAQPLGPLSAWPGVEGGVLAARLAHQLGAPRLCQWILRRLERRSPDDPEVRYAYAYVLCQRRGPYFTWRWMQNDIELRADATAETRSGWYALLGQLAGVLRDFETADAWLQKAEATDPQNPWLHICRSYVLEQEDRYEEALAAARRALELRPMVRAGVQAAGHLLSLLDRDHEALELYTQALATIESGTVAGYLYALQMELRDYASAQRSLDEYARLSPLAEKSVRQWIAAQRSEVAYFLGDMAGAVEHAKACDIPYFKTIAANLEDPARAAAKTVSLPVPFVRQHHMTCAPATLSALSRYWQMPVEHVQVADEICYNGTSNHNERKWAEEHGWVVREFTVTETGAQALLDRGVPFTFTTIEPGNAHLQAIIGYDGRRGTLLVRDPFWRNSGETLADKLIERYRAFGPRGMAMVPQTQAEKLADLDLPDVPLWNLLDALDGALEKHRRQAAQDVYEQMLTAAAEHRLTFEARRRLAMYDCNPTEQLAAVEQLLSQFPDDDRLQYERLAIMRFQASREERLARYAELCRKPDSHPIFWQYYAQELRQDARQHAEVIQLLNKAIRRWPMDAANYYILAHVLWDQRRWDEALELYRFAACLGDKDEQYARSYFVAATWVKQTEKLLKMLRDRFARYGAKSSQPARTLAWSLLQLNREAEALATLEEALRLRADDGPLKLYVADMYLLASSENMPRATELVHEAAGAAPRPDWLRSAARLASAAADPAHALALWRQVLDLQPLAQDAHAAVTRLLAETRGTAAALEHLAATCARFPHHHPLHTTWVEWLRDEPPEVREPVLRRVIGMAPDDAWSRRELAHLLGRLRRLDEAWEQTEIAGKLEPYNPSYPMLRATLLRLEGKLDDAKQELRAALLLSVDSDYAITEWIDLCSTRAERREALTFVRDELVRQVTFGDGLLAFRDHARGVFAADELLAELQAALAARPDLWHAWSAVMIQLLLMDRLDEALACADQATERFPLQARLWIDRSRICRARREFDAELAALENALRIDPGWSLALRTMCDCLARQRDFARARAVAEQAVKHTPLDPLNHVALAEQLWQLDEKPAALARVQQAIQLDPGHEQAWDLLNTWSEELGQPHIAVETARELTARRPGETRSWLTLARMLDGPDQLDERLAAIDKTIELDARAFEAYDLRAYSLAKAGRFDEALAACDPALFGGYVPPPLGARAAWVEAERGDLPKAVARVRQVVADEPHYYQGWARLADWSQLLEDAAGYLEAAEAMVRISPQYEVSMGYLAEARLLNGDRRGAREAYAKAFELAPAYEFAGNGLFDLQLEDGDLSGAARTMEVLRRSSSSGFVLAREAQLAVRQSDRQRALDCLHKICLTPCENRWPLMNTVNELRDSGAGAEAERVLLLALAQPEVLPDVGRLLVEAVMHRVEAERGDLRAALYALEKQLGKQPAHASAWARLADYYQEQQQSQPYLHAAQAMLACDSESDIAHGYLGEARLLAGDRAGAIAALRRGLELNPQYEFASNQLFELHFEDGDLAAAERLIGQLAQQAPGPFLLSRRVQLAARQRQPEVAAGHLRHLCTMATEHRWPLMNAVKAMKEARLGEVAEQTLAAALDDAAAAPDVGLLWVRLAAERDERAVVERLPGLLARGDIGEQALQGYFDRLGKANRQQEVKRFVKQNESWLLADVRGWGQVGWVATLIRDYKMADHYCADWRERPGAQPWMLVNAVEGFRAMGRTEEAIAASRHALTLPPSGGTHLHHLWLACDAACAGDYDAARSHVPHIRREPLDADYEFLETLVRCILDVADAPPQQRQIAFGDAKARINAAQAAYQAAGTFALEPARRKMFYAAVAHLAQQMNTFSARAWSWRWKLSRWGII